MIAAANAAALVPPDVLVAVACDYAERGWHVVPMYAPKNGYCTCSLGAACQHPGKHPRTANGFNAACIDSATIETWWHHWPDSNIGIMLSLSGLIALDVDPRHGGDATLAALEATHGPLPQTVQSETGGGGKHFLFKDPGGELRSGANRLGPGLDVISKGCIVAPPSKHVSGRQYVFEPDSDPGEVGVAPCPAWLLEMIRPAPRQPVPAPAARPLDGKKDRNLIPYVKAALKDEVAAVQTAPEGTRNQALNIAAFNLGQLVGGGCLDRATIERELTAAGAAAGLGLPEIVSTLRSGLGSGLAQPRKPEMAERERRTMSTISTGTPAQVAPAYQPDMETPMVRSYRWQPFPVDVLPPACRRFVREAAEALGVDASYVALPALAVLAGAVGNTRRIALSRSWTAPAVLWPVIVGESGTLKGPVLKAATRPAMKRQRKALDAHKTAMSVYESEAEDHKAALKAWKTGGRDKGEPAPVAPERPPLERCIVSDVTVEALADRLQDNPRGLLLAREELSGWLGSFNAYKSGKGADEAHWLTMFDAVTLVVDRKSTERPTIFVPRAAVSLTGGIQPGILRRMLTQEYQESGMAARLLMTMPPRRAKRWTDREVSRLTEQAFGDVYANLWTLAPVLDDGELRPLDLPLSAEALLLWVDFVNQHGREAVELTGALAAAWSKLEGYAARLALVVELAGWAESPSGDGRGPAEVSAESVRAGIALVEWAGNETRRIYSMLAEDGEERTMREVLELVERRGGTVTARELQQARHYTTAEEAEEILHKMVAAGLGHWVSMPPGPRGGRPSKCFRLASLGRQEAGQHAETDGSCYETPDGDSANEVS